MFDAFVQGDRTLARTEGGLGLGLALVKGITDLHGGSVRAESAGIGRGAEFVVRLPVVSAEPSRAPPSAAGWSRGQSRRVLVVDDNRDAAESLADVLKLAGHQVDVAFDGPSAVATARATSPEFVLCDIGLPGMSGYDVARALRTEGGMKLVALSGYAQPQDVERALESGFGWHLAKPCDPEEIARLLA
jgi:CheY-like chemotaxis protein